MKIIIIGRGPSIRRCTKEFVDSHDRVAIINRVVYDNYEHLVSNHADFMFANKIGIQYNESQVKKLGISKLIFTGNPNQKFETTNANVESIYPNPNISVDIKKIYNFDASSGIQALYYLLNKNYTEISLVGFDFYEVSTEPYYFKPEEADTKNKYLWNSTYKHNKINVPSGHDTDKSIDMVNTTIKNNPQINFNIISNNKTINNFKYPNLKIL